MMGVCSPSTFGVELGAGGVSAVTASPPPNPNLLLWTDEFDNAVWTKTACVIAVDVDGFADDMTSEAPGAAIRQVSATAASTGGPYTATASNHGFTYRADSVTGSFDGTPYVFHLEWRDAGGGGGDMVMRLDRSGGFIRASFEDPNGDGNVIVRHAQLEQGSTPTTYQHRGGS